MHSAVKGNLLSWHDSFVGKKGKKAWRAATLSLFWSCSRKEIGGCLIMSNNWIKQSNLILCLLFWNKLRVYIGNYFYGRLCRLVVLQVGGESLFFVRSFLS